MPNSLFENFSGGMNSRVSPLIMKDSECELIVNYVLDEVGALTKRSGYDVFATQPVAGKRVHGLYQFNHIGDSSNTTQLMVVNNAGDTQSVIYYNNAGTWTSSKADDTAVSTFTNFNRTRFSTFIDYLFRVNGQDVVATSTDPNSASWGTTNAPDDIIPAFTSVFQDRVYFANDKRTGDDRHSSRVYFSSLPSIDQPPTITWDTTNDYFDVNPDDGDEITALENNGNRLLIFKNRALYRWNFGQVEPDRLIGVGTKSQECVKTNLDLGITFFANEYGAYAYTGGRPELISRKIQKWFDAIPAASVDDMCAETGSDDYYLYLADSLTVDGQTYTNVMAVYHISLDAWSIWSLHTPVRVMNKLIQSDSEDIYFGSSNGRTYQLNSGTADDSSGVNGDTATAIHGEIIFKEQLLSFPEVSEVDSIDVFSRNAMSVQCAVRLDRKGDFIPLKGSLTDRVTPLKVGKGGNTFQLRIIDSSIDQTPVIEIYNIQAKERLKTKRHAETARA